MKIFNKGSRHFVTGFGTLAPGGKPIDVPSESADEAKELLRKYPNELVEGGAAEAEMKAAKSALAAKEAAIADKDAEIAKLKDQNAKLQHLVNADAKTPAHGKK